MRNYFHHLERASSILHLFKNILYRIGGPYFLLLLFYCYSSLLYICTVWSIFYVTLLIHITPLSVRSVNQNPSRHGLTWIIHVPKRQLFTSIGVIPCDRRSHVFFNFPVIWSDHYNAIIWNFVIKFQSSLCNTIGCCPWQHV